MPLATLTDLKNRLGQQCPDATQDAVLQAILDMVEEVILKRTGFTFDASARTEQRTNVQLGVVQVMAVRPVVPMSTDPLKTIILKARSLASSTFNDIIGEITDEYEGRVMALASELSPIWPPATGSAPWFRWRRMTWPVVKFTYAVQALGDGTGGTLATPKALTTACIEWAAFVYSRPGGGSTSSITVMGLSEAYVETSEPTLVKALLAPYTRQMARMQV